MTITNATRRRTMLIAWDCFRTDTPDRFGAALRRAWAFVKLTHLKPDQITRMVAAGATHLRMTSLVRRADRRHLGSDAARRQAQFGSQEEPCGRQIAVAAAERRRSWPGGERPIHTRASIVGR